MVLGLLSRGKTFTQSLAEADPGCGVIWKRSFMLAVNRDGSGLEYPGRSSQNR